MCTCSYVSGIAEDCPEHGAWPVCLKTHAATHVVFHDDCSLCVQNQVRAQHVMLRWLAGETS